MSPLQTLSTSLVLPGEGPQAEVACEDPAALCRALLGEVQTLRAQLALQQGSGNPDQLNELLECVSLMRVQFQYNKEQFERVKKEARRAKAEAVALMQEVLQQRELLKAARVEEQLARGRAEAQEAQVAVLRGELQGLRAELGAGQTEQLDRLLVQQQAYRAQFQSQLQLNRTQAQNEELERARQQLQRQLGLAQAQAQAEQPAPPVRELLRETQQLRDQLRLAGIEKEHAENENALLRQQLQFLAQGGPAHRAAELEQRIAAQGQELGAKLAEAQSALQAALQEKEALARAAEQLQQQAQELQDAAEQQEAAHRAQLERLGAAHAEETAFLKQEAQQLNRQNQIAQSLFQNSDAAAVASWNEALAHEVNVLRQRFAK